MYGHNLSHMPHGCSIKPRVSGAMALRLEKPKFGMHKAPETSMYTKVNLSRKR
jgi:hypothetical protein